MEAAKAKNWAVEPQGKKIAFHRIKEKCREDFY
jgi:hypothetical protein